MNEPETGDATYLGTPLVGPHLRLLLRSTRLEAGGTYQFHGGRKLSPYKMFLIQKTKTHLFLPMSKQGGWSGETQSC